MGMKEAKQCAQQRNSRLCREIKGPSGPIPYGVSVLMYDCSSSVPYQIYRMRSLRENGLSSVAERAPAPIGDEAFLCACLARGMVSQQQPKRLYS